MRGLVFSPHCLPLLVLHHQEYGCVSRRADGRQNSSDDFMRRWWGCCPSVMAIAARGGADLHVVACRRCAIEGASLDSDGSNLWIAGCSAPRIADSDDRGRLG